MPVASHTPARPRSSGGRRLARTLVPLAVSVAMAATGLQGFVPAAAADTPPDLTSGLTATQGVDARLDALTFLSGLAAAPPSKQSAQPLRDADGHGRAAVEHVRGDVVLDRATFDHDIALVRTVKTMGGQDSAQAWVTIGSGLLEADRIAAARELDAFLGLPIEDPTPTVRDGRRLTRAEVVDAFMAEYRKARDGQSSRDYVNALGHARDAWLLVHGAVTDFWRVNDTDHDLVPNDREVSAGTDPARADTDGDGLTDAVELLTTMTDPRSTTTYAGTNDKDVDTDRDGLGTAEELRRGTDPIDPDTDGDDLEDGAEVAFGSDPLLADTDDDRLADDSEKRLGTDPRDKDSDDDGVLDGDETYTSRASDSATGVSVAMTGTGDVAETVRFADETDSLLFEEMPGRLSEAVDLTTDKDFSSAEVTFRFDPADVPGGDLDGLAVGWYDEEAGSLVPMPTTVHDGRATATSTHFTTFVLFYLPDWNTVFDLWDPAAGGGGGGGDDRLVDVMLTLDSSGSMSWNDPQGLRRTAAKRFVDGLIDGDRAGVVDFDSWGYLAQPLTTDFALAKAAIDAIDDSGGTNIAAGVDLANQELITRGSADRFKVQILLTDGEGYYDPSLTQQAVDNDITIFTIGLGSYVDAGLLGGIASATGGRYFPVATAEDLPDVFDRIGGDIGEGQDLDEDGLDDRHELTGIVLGTGITVYTDPRDPDTDGDGLLDGDEVVLERGWDKPYPTMFYKLLSSPHAVDTDSDGLSDPEELDLTMDAVDPDMDDDGASDGVEYVSAMDVANPNPDGDQYDDGEELGGRTDPFTYDPSLADRTRAFAAGALLGELGYWLADHDVEVAVAIAYPRFGPPFLATTVHGIGACSLPLIRCDELTKFQPFLTDLPEYVFGMVLLGLIPFVDIAVAVRDAIGAAMSGEYGWAIFEIAAGALGFFVPVAGDIPGIVKDVGKWLARAVDFGKKSDEIVAFVAKAADDTPAAEKVFVPLVKGFKQASYDVLSNKNVSDTDMIRLAASGQDLDALALVVQRADEVASVGRWFDDALTPRGYWGREAEDFVRTLKGGVSKRFDTLIEGVGKFRIADSASDGLRRLDEVKTGDGRLDDRMLVQITKDEDLLDRGVVESITWNFFPSGRSNRLGPDPALLDELRMRGIAVKIWLP